MIVICPRIHVPSLIVFQKSIQAKLENFAATPPEMVSGFCNKKLAKILPKDFVMANPDKEMSI